MSSETAGVNGAPDGTEKIDRIGHASDTPQLTVFRPFIPAEAHLRELTLLPLVLGTLLGIVFGASSLYLVLKVGLTVSASIPVAVISITVFRALSKIRIAPIAIRAILAILFLAAGIASI